MLMRLDMKMDAHVKEDERRFDALDALMREWKMSMEARHAENRIRFDTQDEKLSLIFKTALGGAVSIILFLLGMMVSRAAHLV